ncbi:MAG: NAD(P)/FAD-dependent oxidoreductase [Chloroflexota bacterium]
MPTEKIKSIGKTEEAFDTIVIGGGQAGLAAGYFLMQQGANFIILDEHPRTGDSWRKRWDDLKLFTPGKFNGLPGLPFPKPADHFPDKDEVADYLEGYALRFNLPIRRGVKVSSLTRDNQAFRIDTGKAVLSARNVIIASGPFQTPFIPAFSNELDPSIHHFHSSEYRNPQQVQSQSVLVVGAGNSGAEIALELVKAGKRVWLAGRDVGRIPANGPLGQFLGGYPIWWFMSHVLTVNTPIGRKVRSGEFHHGTPLGRATRREIIAAGVELTQRVSGIHDGKPQLEDGRILPVEGVVWATGFRPDYRWIDLPVFDEQGYPRHSQGVVPDAPGLYFIGLFFQRALNSSLLGGVGADVAYIASQVARHVN